MSVNDNTLDYINQGITLMKLQKYTEARDTFRSALELKPNDYEAYMHLGNAYVNLDELDNAIQAFTSALVINKKSGETLFSIANVYYLKDDNKNAIKYYVKAENNGYHTADMYLIMGNIFYSIGDIVQALRYVARAVKEQPLRGEIWRQKILLELELGSVDAALDSLDEFEALLPDALDVHEIRTKILTNLGQLDEAREHLNKALSIFPDDVRIYLLKIHLEILREDFDDAKADIATIKANGLDKGYRKRIALEEASLYLREQKTDEIIKSLSWGLEEAPNDTDLLFVMLNTYIATLDYANIIKLADQLLGGSSIDPLIMATAEFYRALSLRETGKIDEAADKFKGLAKRLRKVTIENPDNIEIFIYRLLTHNALKEYEQAFELADYLGKVSPNKADAHRFRSLIYKDMGDEEKAKFEIEQAEKISPIEEG